MCGLLVKSTGHAMYDMALNLKAYGYFVWPWASQWTDTLLFYIAALGSGMILPPSKCASGNLELAEFLIST